MNNIRKDVGVQEGIYPVNSEDFPRLVEVWEASVRATHLFLTEADIQFFKPLVQDALSHMAKPDSINDIRNYQRLFTADHSEYFLLLKFSIMTIFYDCLRSDNILQKSSVE